MNELKKELIAARQTAKDQNQLISAIRRDSERRAQNMSQQMEHLHNENESIRRMPAGGVRSDPQTKAKMREYELKYADEKREKEDAYKRIRLLENELKSQEDFFNKERDG